jgi:hypothetical protein
MKITHLARILIGVMIILTACENINQSKVLNNIITLTNGTPTSTITQTPSPTQKDKISQTLDAMMIKQRNTEIAAQATLEERSITCGPQYRYFGIATDVLSGLDKYISLSGEKWTAFTCIPINITASTFTRIINSDKTKDWILNSYPDYIPDRNYYFSPYKMDKNTNSLFLDPGFEGSIDGWTPYWFLGMMENRGSIYSVNLDNGEVSTVLPINNNKYYFNASISPSTNYLAYSFNKGNELFVQNLVTKKAWSIKLGNSYDLIGGFVWRQDRDELIFAATTIGWEGKTAGISLYKITLDNKSLKLLLYNDCRNLVPWFNTQTNEMWKTNTLLNLVSIDLEHETGIFDIYSINIDSGEIIQNPIVTPTVTQPDDENN